MHVRASHLVGEDVKRRSSGSELPRSRERDVAVPFNQPLRCAREQILVLTLSLIPLYHILPDIYNI